MSQLDDEDAVDAALTESDALPSERVRDVGDFSVQDFVTYALLRWSWPAGCSQVTLTWRPDVYPRGADDPRARSLRVTRAEYDRHGGFHLERPAAAPHHFVVYAMAQLEGQPTFARGTSPGARGVMRYQTSDIVSYNIKRQWLRRSHVTIELRASCLIEFLPTLIVVAKPGELQPINPKDGVVVLELSALHLTPNTPSTHDINLEAVRTPVYLRAFFPKAGARFRLLDPPHEQLKLQ